MRQQPVVGEQSSGQTCFAKLMLPLINSRTIFVIEIPLEVGWVTKKDSLNLLLRKTCF